MNWVLIKVLWNEYCKVNGISRCAGLMAVDMERFFDFCNQKLTESDCTGCTYNDGFNCTRSPIVTDGEEKCKCDKEEE